MEVHYVDVATFTFSKHLEFKFIFYIFCKYHQSINSCKAQVYCRTIDEIILQHRRWIEVKQHTLVLLTDGIKENGRKPREIHASACFPPCRQEIKSARRRRVKKGTEKKGRKRPLRPSVRHTVYWKADDDDDAAVAERWTRHDSEHQRPKHSWRNMLQCEKRVFF